VFVIVVGGGRIGFYLTKELLAEGHELSALFRKPGHKHYRPCQDQVLRRFLHGMQLAFRPEAAG